MSYSSIKGRDLGIDRKTGAIVARNGIRADIQVPSTGVTIPNSGLSVFTALTTSSYTLAAPAQGVRKELFGMTTSTSTAAKIVTLASGNFQSTASSTYTIATINGVGQSISLIGLSTSRYGVLSNAGVTLS